MPYAQDMTEKDIELIRYDDGEFILTINSEQIGSVLTNKEARQVKLQLQAGTFDLHDFIKLAGVV